MADVVDDDTLQAVLALWQTDQKNLPSLVTELPKTGRMTSPQVAPGKGVYVHIACEFARRELASSAGAWHDFRKITITARGVKADVNQVLAWIGDLFNLNTVLNYPSGAIFRRWWPIVGSDMLTEEPTTKDSKDIWAGSAEGEVWSVRQSGVPNLLFITATPNATALAAALAKGTGSSGSVTSVALAMPASTFVITGSPIAGAGTINVTFASFAARNFLASPVNVPGVPGPRTIQAADLGAGSSTVGFVAQTDGTLVHWVDPGGLVGYTNGVVIISGQVQINPNYAVTWVPQQTFTGGIAVNGPYWTSQIVADNASLSGNHVMGTIAVYDNTGNLQGYIPILSSIP